MKKFNKRLKSLSICLSSFIFDSSAHEANSNKYGGIFTTRIYELDKNKFKNLSDAEIDKIVVENLHKAKREQLEEDCIKRIEKKIKWLQEQYKPAKKAEFWEELLKSISLHLPGLMKDLVKYNFPKSELMAIAAPVAAIAVIGIGKYLTQEANDNFPNTIALIKGEIQKLDSEIYDLLKGLDYEPIKDLEEAYVKHKRKMDNKGLKNTIEEKLIGIRGPEFFKAESKRVIISALKLPVGRPFIVEADNITDRNGLLTKLQENKYFCNYTKNVQDPLQTILTEVASSSERRTYYFWGSPSSGKTTAAKIIPQTLGLPFYETTFFDSSEIVKISGSCYYYANASPGWLINAYITPSEDIPNKRMVLIINEIDRLIESKNPEVNNFLLAFLDPNKKKDHNNYFEADLDISNLIVILTANSDISEDKFFQALKNRISLKIEFPKLADKTTNQAAQKKLEAIAQKYSLLKPFQFTYAGPYINVSYDLKSSALPKDEWIKKHNLQEGINDVLMLLTKKLGYNYEPNEVYFKIETGITTDTTVRQIIDNGILSFTINKFMNKILITSERIYNSSKTTKDNKYKYLFRNMASICRHPDAIYALSQSTTDNEQLFWLKKGKQLKHPQCMHELVKRYKNEDQLEKAKRLFNGAYLRGHKNALTELSNVGILFLQSNKISEAKDCFSLMKQHDKKLYINTILKDSEISGKFYDKIDFPVFDSKGDETTLKIGKYYKIINDKTKTAINVYASSKKEEYIVQPVDNNKFYETHRLFRFIPNSTGDYYIQNKESDAFLNLTQTGLVAQQYIEDAKGKRSLFKLIPHEKDTYFIEHATKSEHLYIYSGWISHSISNINSTEKDIGNDFKSFHFTQ